MPASTSSARKARRSNGAGDGTQNLNRAAHGERPQEGQAGGPRAQAAVGVPLVAAHLCADHRRRERRDSGCGLVAGKTDARKPQGGRQCRRRQGGRQADRRARAEEGTEGRRVRPRRLSLPRAREGAGRRCPRGRPQFLIDWNETWHVNMGTGKSATASSSTSSSTSTG